MPHAFRGAIIAPKCQDLICGFVTWTHRAGRGATRELRWDTGQQMCGGGGGDGG